MPYISAAILPADRAPRRSDPVWAVIFLLFLTAPAVFTVPGAVNAGAWLAGAGRADTFTGGSYGTQCAGGGSCTAVTYGTLASTGQVITWPGRVPLGRPVPLRDPVWNLMRPRPAGTVPDALAGLALGLFFGAVAAGAVALFAVRPLRRAARARRYLARERAAAGQGAGS